MDSLTHLVAGALTPLAFRSAPRRTALVVFGILAGELPDIDAFFLRGTPEGALAVHRGITHALAWQPILMLALVLPFFIWLTAHPLKTALATKGFPSAADSGISPSSLQGKGLPSLPLLCTIAFPALIMHIWLDCMTTFGTQALLPFSPTRVAWPSMFIVDLIILLPTLAALVIALRSQGKGEYYSAKTRLWARAGLAWMVVYPVISLGVHALATQRAAEVLQVPTAQVRLFTTPFSPFIWKCVVQEENNGKTQFRVSTFTLRNFSPSSPVSLHNAPDAPLVEKFEKQIPLFATFTAFSTSMVQEEKPSNISDKTEEITIYTFKDLRYIPSPQDISRSFRGGIIPFVFEIMADKRGSVRAYRYLPRAGDSPAWQFPS